MHWKPHTEPEAMELGSLVYKLQVTCLYVLRRPDPYSWLV